MQSPPNDLLLRMAAEQRLRLAEARVETAARRAIAGWLQSVQAALLADASNNLTAAGYGWDTNAVDAANEFNAWRQGLDAHILPTVSIVFGEAFQQLRRTADASSLAAQQQFLAEVSDRLRIWPEGIFEEIRPDLLEAMSDAATFEEMKDRIGAILSVDTETRDLRAQIGDVDRKLADPDLPEWRRESLTARRRSLWNAHDESLSGWEWKARRIARTEAHAAMMAGQIAAARQAEQDTGDTYYKRWLCVTGDTRTRPTHVVADGQMVRLGEKFRVGGFLLDFPGEPVTIAPHETINCRCALVVVDIDAMQAELQGSKGSLGNVVPGGRRLGPDDPDDVRAAVEQVAADRNLPTPADQRGEDFGQQQPTVEPVDPPAAPDAPIIDAPDDLTGMSTDALIELMIAAANADNDELYERVDAEFDRRAATIDDTPIQGTLEPATSDDVPDDLSPLTEDALTDLLYSTDDDALIARIEAELDRRLDDGFTAAARSLFDEAKHRRGSDGRFARTAGERAITSTPQGSKITDPPFGRFTRKYAGTTSQQVAPRVAGDIRDDYRNWLDHRNDMKQRGFGGRPDATGWDRDIAGRTAADYDMNAVVDDTLASGLNTGLMRDGDADDEHLDMIADAMWTILERHHTGPTSESADPVDDVVHTGKNPDATGADAVAALDRLDDAITRLHTMRPADFSSDPEWSSWLIYDGSTRQAVSPMEDRLAFFDNVDAGKISTALAKSGLNLEGIGHPAVSRDTQRQIVEQLERMSNRALVSSGISMRRRRHTPVFELVAAVRRVRSAEGAARYQLPIGSIIVARDRKGQVHNFTEHSDHDLIELMESTAISDKNPTVYEAAFTEWARRQPDLEPDDVDPDMREDDDPTRTDQLDMLGAERDRAFKALDEQTIADDAEFDDVLARFETYDAIVAHERSLAATKTDDPATGEAAPAWDVDDSGSPVVEVEVSPARQRQWALMEQADQLSQEQGITYEEALGQLQGLDPDQVHRREFVRIAQEQGYRGTSFNKLVSEVHFDAVAQWEAELEDATNGHYLRHEYASGDVNLWSVNDNAARQYMTPEAAQWFDEQGGRVTKADLVALIESGQLESYDPWTIQAAFAASSGRHTRGDYLR